MARKRNAALILSAVLLVAGCGSHPAKEFSPELVADLKAQDANAVGHAVNQFGFDLMGALDGQPDKSENTITSPLSAATLLAMVLAGAGGDTAAEMAKVLHLEDSRDVRVGQLLQLLTDTDQVTMTVDNALFPKPGFTMKPGYESFIADGFNATVTECDLSSAEGASRIDAWVNEKTRGKIPTIAEDLGLPNPSAVLVLLNAVYFLGTWTTEFNPRNTSNSQFNLADGSRVEVPLMNLYRQDLEIAERGAYRMLRLPYGQDGRYGMEVILPNPDQSLPELMRNLDAAEWRTAVQALHTEELHLVSLPKFELKWDASLVAPLRALGMDKAFKSADFSAMTDFGVSLSEVVQKTYINVDEKGTEAAAVTGGSMTVSAPGADSLFIVDRPFAFTISDRQTGTILFLGSIADPRE